MRKGLTCIDSLKDSDLIFALAGQQRRKIHALKLLKEGWAKALLLSTGRFDIRRFADLDLPAWPRLWEMRCKTPARERHFFVSFDGLTWDVERIPVQTFGTLREIEALGRWLEKRPQIRSLLIVSSGLHLRRVGLCCSKLLPGGVTYRLTSVPDEEAPTPKAPGREGNEIGPVVSEWLKLGLYGVLFSVGGSKRARGSTVP